ncbi:MBL fold metallo-hydrolase [Desulfitobacterium metallireducens]|uniref:Hydrolase n=1 Tax=Desulfitobacterium metallireducens DSM 15288 TaxID=871968 RepID=W0EGX8_9FIRM|nr:MBL fold metallo-hydrolase [Desulfitobacterium metallireducens]AHF08311.1 hydrolase [Desulfitobacterium metallireducens DSM 15288]
MGDNTIKINYLYHSGFSVETKGHILIFDYYQGPIQLSDKPTYIFSSHSHADHFNPIIFEWQRTKADIHYILSSDISIPPEVTHTQSLSPYEECTIDGLKIKAYNSTDIGVSFLVECEGIHLFHAGDLNWWYWIDTPEEMEKAESGYKNEIEKIKGEPIDIAFFPVDPRLEKNYSAGAEHFIQEVHPQVLIPMHSFGHDEVAVQFAEKMEDSPTQILTFSDRSRERSLSFPTEK